MTDEADKPTTAASDGPSRYDSLSAALPPPHLQEALLSPTATLRDRQPSLSDDGCTACRKRCCSRPCCIALLCLLVGFGSGGGLVWALMRSFQGDGGGAASGGGGGSGAVCGACAGSRLEGAFTALVDDPPTKYTLTHTFRANHTASGVSDVVLHAIKSPLNALKSFTCNDVPFTVDPLSCVVKMTDDCLACAAPPLARTLHGPTCAPARPLPARSVHPQAQCRLWRRSKNLKASLVTSMRYEWDGNNTLTVFEQIDVPILGKKSYQWNETRGANLTSLLAAK